MATFELPQPSEWHSQDWILVVQALCFYATSEVATDIEYEHVHQLVDEIAAQEGLEASELLLQAAPLSDRYSIGTTSR